MIKYYSASDVNEGDRVTVVVRGYDGIDGYSVSNMPVIHVYALGFVTLHDLYFNFDDVELRDIVRPVEEPTKEGTVVTFISKHYGKNVAAVSRGFGGWSLTSGGSSLWKDLVKSAEPGTLVVVS